MLSPDFQPRFSAWAAGIFRPDFQTILAVHFRATLAVQLNPSWAWLRPAIWRRFCLSTTHFQTILGCAMLRPFCHFQSPLSVLARAIFRVHFRTILGLASPSHFQSAFWTRFGEWILGPFWLEF